MSRQKYFLLIRLLIIGLLFSVIKPVSAEDYVKYHPAPISQADWPGIGKGAGYMRFEHLGAAEGLSENTVLTILQDSQGFLWFGTQEGLNKYDGYSFTVYKADPNNPGSLSDSHITAIEEASDGSLWIGTYYGGLNLFSPAENTFRQFLSDPEDPSALPDERINTLLEDSQGNLWVGTRKGLSLLNPDKRSFTHFQHNPDDPESLSSDHIRSIYEADGNLWIGTENGLNLFKKNEGRAERFLTGIRSGVSMVQSISGDGNGGLWLGTQGGLIHFDTNNFTHRLYQYHDNQRDALSSNRINVVYRDRSDNLWVGFEDQGINLVTDIIDGRRIRVDQFVQQEFDPDSLNQNEILAIFEDRSGVMWFGTRGGGINKANPSTRAFGYYQHVPGHPNTLSGNNISALAYDAARRSLWIGTTGAGLDRLNLITGEFTHFRHNPGDAHSLDSDYINLLHMGQRGELYVSTEEGMLKTYDAITNGFAPVYLDPADNFGEELLTAITHDPEGMLWVSEASGELARIDPDNGSIHRYNLPLLGPATLMDVLVMDIYADPAGILWLATENHGLVRFDPASDSLSVMNVQDGQDGPSHNSIINIYPQGSDVLWLGTAGGGLNRYIPETGEFTYYTIEDGLPSNRVFGIIEDDSGCLWLSTGNGLARFCLESGIINTYDTRDGLQGKTYNRSAHASSSNGVLFFGGVNGLNAFHPSSIEQNNHVPPVVITKVTLFNQILATDISDCSTALTLRHDQNFLSFEFTALDFTSPDNNQYAYIMEGLNEDYVNAGNRRYADYPNLTWGTYTFRLIGSNNHGVWNTAGACVNITIETPFWSTWWFIGLVGLFLAASVVFGYRWRLHNLEQQRQRMAVDVFERTQEIERRRQMASGLSEVVRLLNTNQPLDMSLDFIAKQSVGLTAASKAAIFERQGDQVIVRACYPEGETYPLDLNDPNSASAKCLRESTLINRLLIFSRIDPQTMKSDTRWELVSGEFRTAFCTPLVVEDGVYGGLVLYYGEERIFTPDEINLAHTLADQASLAIANELLKREAQDAAVTDERNRLARDLHDAVTQTLFSTSLIADVLPKIWEKDPEQAQQRLDQLRQLTRGALGEMRTMLMELRPSALQEADPVELFKHLTDAFTGRTGVPVQFEIDVLTDREIPTDVKNAFYRIAQEGLNNILKHAEAATVWFHFSVGAEFVAMTISDNGVGFDWADVPPGHLGLSIMNERAESIGADLNLTSRAGEGTNLRLVWRFSEIKIE